MSMTDIQIRKLAPREKQYTVTDKNGLFLIVTPNGGKWWRVRYRYGGKKCVIACGVYPEISLLEARKKCFEINNILAQGADPKNPYRLEVKNKTFKEVATEWFEQRSPDWTAGHKHSQELRLFNGILPVIGHLPIAKMIPADYIKLYKLRESEGKIETAHRYAHICAQISRFARINGYTQFDVASGLTEVLKKRRPKHFATITTPEEIGALLAAIDSYPDRSTVKFALKIMPYVFVRSGELRAARWSEFDLKQKSWLIPAERMKMRRPHYVPLARQVVAILEDLHVLTGNGELLFPGFIAKNKAITDVALLNALRRLGYDKAQMTIHGFRSMASTILNEKKYLPDVIETQLAHARGNAVREAYNHALYLEDRAKMMQEYADYLDTLRDQAIQAQ